MTIGDDITFHVERVSFHELLEIFHDSDRICEINIFLWHHIYCISMYENRTSVVLGRGKKLNITISTAELSDIGSYEVHEKNRNHSTCFSVYIVGKLCCNHRYKLYVWKLTSLCFPIFYS